MRWIGLDVHHDFCEVAIGIPSFVEGARVRADVLGSLAEAVGGAWLGQAVRSVLVEHPPPACSDGQEVVAALEASTRLRSRRR